MERYWQKAVVPDGEILKLLLDKFDGKILTKSCCPRWNFFFTWAATSHSERLLQPGSLISHFFSFCCQSCCCCWRCCRRWHCCHFFKKHCISVKLPWTLKLVLVIVLVMKIVMIIVVVFVVVVCAVVVVAVIVFFVVIGIIIIIVIVTVFVVFVVTFVVVVLGYKWFCYKL